MRAFPWNPLEQLTASQRDRLAAYRDLLLHFNQRINLISRDAEVYVEERHLIHSLALTLRSFPAGTTVVDWGTGGGLPAIPLAICFSDVTFHAVDAVGKKIQAVRAMGRRLGLDNLQPWHGRAEDWPGTAHYSVSRATAPLADLWRWHARACSPEGPALPEEAWRPGLLCLKGGDLREEMEALHGAYATAQVETMPLQPLLGRPYFARKFIVTVNEV